MKFTDALSMLGKDMVTSIRRKMWIPDQYLRTISGSTLMMHSPFCTRCKNNKDHHADVTLWHPQIEDYLAEDWETNIR